MDLNKIAQIGEEIYNLSKYLSNDADEVSKLKELAVELFSELDINYN